MCTPCALLHKAQSSAEFYQEERDEILLAGACPYCWHRTHRSGASAKLPLVCPVRHRDGRDELRLRQFRAVYGHGQRHWRVLRREYAIPVAGGAAFAAPQSLLKESQLRAEV